MDPAGSRPGTGHARRFPVQRSLRDCLKNKWGPVFAEKALWRGATREHTRQRSVTEEQRSQRAFSAKTLRATGLLREAFVGSTVTARCGDAPVSPPRPRTKSLVAGLPLFFRQSLRAIQRKGVHPVETKAQGSGATRCGGGLQSQHAIAANRKPALAARGFARSEARRLRSPRIRASARETAAHGTIPAHQIPRR